MIPWRRDRKLSDSMSRRRRDYRAKAPHVIAVIAVHRANPTTVNV